MSVLDLTAEQILTLIRQLPATAKRAALLALAREADAKQDDRMAAVESRLRAAAKERGLDWDALDEAGREELVDRLLHET